MSNTKSNTDEAEPIPAWNATVHKQIGGLDADAGKAAQQTHHALPRLPHRLLREDTPRAASKKLLISKVSDPSATESCDG